MGFLRDPKALERRLREQARREVLAVLAFSRKLQQAKEDAWYEKFQQAQKNRAKPD